MAFADVKESKAMEQIRAVSRPCASGDIVGCSRLGHRRAQAAGGDGRRDLRQPDTGLLRKARDDQRPDQQAPQFKR